MYIVVVKMNRSNQNTIHTFIQTIDLQKKNKQIMWRLEQVEINIYKKVTFYYKTSNN